jgi:hypothetical protein
VESDESTISPEDALDRLGVTRLTEHSMRTLLGQIAGLAQQSLPGGIDTSVTLLTGDNAVTVVSTGRLAMDLDESQYGLGHGPCLHAAAEGELVEVPDTRADARWPDFNRSAAERGCLSMVSAPLPMHEAVSGALNVYAR